MLPSCKSCNNEPNKQCKHGKRLYLNGLRCCSCQMVRTREEFNTNKSRPDGYHSSCKACMKALPPRGTGVHQKKEDEPDKRVKYFMEYQYTYKVFNLTKEQFLAIISRPCYYCDGWLTGKEFCGIDRVDRSKETQRKQLHSLLRFV